MAEDVTLKTVNDSENRQTLLYGMGDQHLEITASKLAARYKCEIRLETPKVAFRETIKKKSDVDSKYKKQSGGHGQYGHVKMRFEASGDLETPYVFEEEVVGGAVPKNYFPAVEKGLQEAVVKGPLAGYPVVGVKPYYMMAPIIRWILPRWHSRQQQSRHSRKASWKLLRYCWNQLRLLQLRFRMIIPEMLWAI